MKDTEKFCHVRLKDDEIEYIDNHWNGKFSNFVHSAIKKEKLLTKNNRIKNQLQNSLSLVVMLGIGAIFVFFSLGIQNFVGFLLVLLLGIFFMITALVSIFVEVYNKWKMNS